MERFPPPRLEGQRGGPPKGEHSQWWDCLPKSHHGDGGGIGAPCPQPKTLSREPAAREPGNTVFKVPATL